jgi:hypothetical protein
MICPGGCCSFAEFVSYLFEEYSCQKSHAICILDSVLRESPQNASCYYLNRRCFRATKEGIRYVGSVIGGENVSIRTPLPALRNPACGESCPAESRTGRTSVASPSGFSGSVCQRLKKWFDRLGSPRLLGLSQQ